MQRWKSLVTFVSIALILVLPAVTLNFDNGSIMSTNLVDSPTIIAGVTNGQAYINGTYDSIVGANRGDAVIELDDGGFLIGTTINNGSNDYGLVRVDSSGNYLWNKTYGDANSNVLVSLIKCSDGGFALMGNTYNTPVPGTYNDIWLVRIDSSGNMLWNETYGGPYNDYSAGIIEIDDGFIIAGTYHVSNSPDWDFWLIHTNETGSVEWSETFGNTGTQICQKMIQTSDSNYVLCGRNDPDNWLVKTDLLGNQIWNKTLSGIGSQSVYDIIECDLGGFAISGKSGESMLLLRTDSNGNHVWNATYFRADWVSTGYSLVETSDHGFVLVGTCESGGSDALTSLHPLAMQEESGTVWLLKTNSTGNIVWDHYLGSEGDRTTVLTNAKDGGYVITGGTSDGHIFLWVIPELDWIQTPVDQDITTDSLFIYQLEATSAAPLSWHVNNTSFLIDSEGVLRNATVLEARIYELSLTVTDAVDNTLTAHILVTVILDSTTNTTTTTTTITTDGGQTLLLLAVSGIGGAVVIV
ncbi:MAG: cadherin repeat domain-containing protein, partial [Candidatus Thorarchaeota archaeon]